MKLHFVLIFESKDGLGELRTVTETLSGEDLEKRMTSIIELYNKRVHEAWKLIAFSHTFLSADMHL
ncbi:MAG: hypothetical protein Q8R40_04740 [bacterium]|nr:hypothetical protein [bacterium]